MSLADSITPFAPVPGRARRRSAELVPLSHDHHQALAQAIVLKRATSANADEAWRGFLAFWQAEGAEHFAKEEVDLLPAYARVADPAHPAVLRMLLEHVLLRARIAELDASPERDPVALNELGAWLDLHVRHEERVLFPLIEDALDWQP
jgi:hypothetical protein